VIFPYDNYFFALKLWFAVGIAVGYCWCNYAAPLVQGCCTFGAMVLALLVQLPDTVGPAMLYCWSSYLVLLVPGCFTFLVLLLKVHNPGESEVRKGLSPADS